MIMVPAFTPPKALSSQKNGPARRTQTLLPTAMNWISKIFPSWIWTHLNTTFSTGLPCSPDIGATGRPAALQRKRRIICRSISSLIPLPMTLSSDTARMIPISALRRILSPARSPWKSCQRQWGSAGWESRSFWKVKRPIIRSVFWMRSPQMQRSITNGKRCATVKPGGNIGKPKAQRTAYPSCTCWISWEKG